MRGYTMLILDLEIVLKEGYMAHSRSGRDMAGIQGHLHIVSNFPNCWDL